MKENKAIIVLLKHKCMQYLGNKTNDWKLNSVLHNTFTFLNATI